MARDKIQDLRHHLFETIEMLKDKEMDIATAKAISNVAQVIVNSAKIEVQFIKATQSTQDTGFIQLEKKTSN
jgi:hypothetical protein